MNLEKSLFLLLLGMLAMVIFWPPATITQFKREAEWKGWLTVGVIMLIQVSLVVGVVYSLFCFIY